MPLFLLILSGTFGLAAVFIACELAHRLTDAFNGIGHTADQLDWYLFPIEVKRMLPMVIVIAKQPVTIACFGNIICSREVFKNVSAFLLYDFNNHKLNYSNLCPHQFFSLFRLFIGLFRFSWCSVDLVVEILTR